MDAVGSRPASTRNSFENLHVEQSMDVSDDADCENLDDVCSEPGRLSSPIVKATRQSKRKRIDLSESSGKEIDEEGFSLVQYKSTRLAKNKQTLLKNTEFDSGSNHLSGIEVCLSSFELLPKQIGLAKLLKTENIKNIKQIKYKSPYKVHILFENREDADVLLNNKKFSESGYRCNLTTEVGITYGVVRHLEMDIKEEELLKTFKCIYDIVAVKRLKRSSDRGDWVMSETVRFAFKGAKLPEYIYGYGCRFKIEPFTFPVTQCSACWRFGHLSRTCPVRKILCPKCGKGHANCDVTRYKCLNCNGGHMAFDKSCPVYLKEKEIRTFMSKDNCTYKTALLKYNSYNASHTKTVYDKSFELGNSSKGPDSTWPRKSYSQSIGGKVTQSDVCNQENEQCSNMIGSEASDNELKEDSSEENTGKKHAPGTKKKTSRNRKSKGKTDGSFTHEWTAEREEQRDNARCGQSYLNIIIRKAKEIICSKENFEEKVRIGLQFVVEEIFSFIIKTMSSGEVFTKVIDIFRNG